MTALDEIAPAFVAMAHRIVWSTVATVEPDGRPRTRILHPIWEWEGGRLQGWIATGPTAVKRAAMETTPNVSVTYWDPSHDTCTADCRVGWILDDDGRRQVWERFASGPAPVGYDPAIIPIWVDGPTSPEFAAWRLDPYRLRVMAGTVMTTGQGGPMTWAG
jgi:hypothetical protein